MQVYSIKGGVQKGTEGYSCGVELLLCVECSSAIVALECQDAQSIVIQ